jgi:hypothetical protein
MMSNEIKTDDHKAEFEMRDSKAPFLDTEEELLAYIRDLVERKHDYGTCVYAASMAATAAFNYVAGTLGMTGFQASCADMDILRRTRHIEGPFSLFRYRDLLYPQYDLHERLAKQIDEARPWLAEKAREFLAAGRDAAPDVVAHWEKLAAYKGEG